VALAARGRYREAQKLDGKKVVTCRCSLCWELGHNRQTCDVWRLGERLGNESTGCRSRGGREPKYAIGQEYRGATILFRVADDNPIRYQCMCSCGTLFKAYASEFLGPRWSGLCLRCKEKEPQPAAAGRMEWLPDERFNPEQAIVQKERMTLLVRVLDALETKNQRLSGLVSMRYGLLDGNERTQQQVSDALHVTRQAVSHSEKLCFRFLRAAVAKCGWSMDDAV